jgi:hypothetical protein
MKTPKTIPIAQVVNHTKLLLCGTQKPKTIKSIMDMTIKVITKNLKEYNIALTKRDRLTSKLS